MKSSVSIVLVEDSPLDAELALEHVKRAGIEPLAQRVEDRDSYVKTLSGHCPDVILSDYSLPSFDGLSALDLAQEICPDTPFLFVSGAIGEDVAIESLKRGATDYILKQRLDRLGPAVNRALREAQQRVERRQALEELDRRARELAVLNGDLQQFVYAASHDLQEPLRSISIFSKLLLTKYRGRLDEQADEYLGYLESAAQHMSALLEDLLVYAKVPAHDHNFKPVNLNSVLSQTLYLLQTPIKESAAVVESENLPVVQGDATQLGLVLQNLISNSLKYRSAAPPKIAVKAVPAGNQWVISVQDNGQGFEQSYADHVFGLFKRLNKRDQPGTGLGLAICKRILELHGGRIWAEAKPGEGATFSFTLSGAREDS